MKKFTLFIIPALVAGVLLAYSSDVQRIAAKESDGVRTTRLSQRQDIDRSEENTLSGIREHTSSLDVKEAIRIDINEKMLGEKRLLEIMRKPPDLIPFDVINNSVMKTIEIEKREDTDYIMPQTKKSSWHKPEKSLYVPGEVLIQLRQDTREAVNLHTDAGIARFGIMNLDMLGEQFGVTAISPVLETVPDGGEAFGLDLIFVMEVSDDTDIEALSEVYRTVPEVDEVSPNYIPFKHDARAPGRVIPDDPYYDWSDSIVKGPECWDIPETGDNSVIMAVLDIERLYETHPDLDGNYLGMKGGIVGTLDHGTMCISVACAELDNALGISGLCGGWDGTQGVRWTGYVFTSAADNIVGINWVTTAGADIITESIGFTGNPAGLESAFEWAYSQGVLSFASAGNDAGSTEPGWPAYYGVVIAVGGVGPGGKLWDWGNGVGSNVGEYVDIMGPGDAQYTCDATSYTNGYGGTSFATPAAAACAALMLSDNNSLTPAQLRDRMIRAADYNEHKSPEYSGLMGAGIVNLYEAVKSCNVNVSVNEMLDVPASTPTYSAVYPKAIVQNRGTSPATFRVIAQAQQLGTVYADTVWVTDLPPNNEYSQHAEFVEFKRWNPISGTYTFRIFTSLPGDMNPANDTLTRTVIATSGGTDTLLVDTGLLSLWAGLGSSGWAGATQIPIPQPCSVMAILYMPGDPNSLTPVLNWRLWEDNGSGGNPGTLVRSGSVTPAYGNWYRVDISPYFVTGGYLYAGWADVSAPFIYNGIDDNLDDYNWWYNGANWVLLDYFNGDFMIRLIVKLPAKYDHDAAAYAILNPGTHVISSTPYIPECEVKNIGKNTESFPVYFTVDSAGTQIYSGSASVTDLAPDVRDTVTFSSWMPKWDGGTYNAMVYTDLTGDQDTGNDTVTMNAACSLVDTLYYDAGVFKYIGGDSLYLAVRFTVDKPVEITAVQYYLYLRRESSQAPEYVRDTVFIWESDAGSIPGSQLYSSTHMPAGPTGSSSLAWHTYTLAENIPHGPGDFWVGMWQPGLVGYGGAQNRDTTEQYLMLDGGTELFRSVLSYDKIDWSLLNVDAMIRVIVQYGDSISTHDVMTTEITEPLDIVSTLYDYDVAAWVKNNGASTETFDVVARIAESGGSQVYYQTVSVSGLEPGEFRHVNFPQWQPTEAYAYYDLTVYTALGSDVYRYNDTLYQDSIYSTPNAYIWYDNGTPTWYWGDPDYRYTAQRFTAPQPGWLVGCWVAMESDVTPWPDCSIFVWDDDDGWNDGGLPDPDALRLSGTISFDPGGTGGYWFYVTFPPVWIDTTSDFFIGVWNAEPPYILLDNATYEWRSFCAEHPDSAWQSISLDLLLQAVMRYEYGDAPEAPYIYAEKTAGKDSVRLYWDAVTQDTTGELAIIEWYEIYADDDPAFIPASGNWLGSPEGTYYVDPITQQDHYYLNHAVSIYFQASEKSNMGYAFHKSLNENAGPTSDRNWVSLPWHSEYASVSDLTDDLSPAGDPIIVITTLQDNQLYVSWIWDPDFLEWYGTDFVIEPGCAYEMVTSHDETILLVGSNDPDGEAVLNENAGAVSDRNWVSIPYNAVYTAVSDITADYSSTGDAVILITNLRDDQYYVSWIWDPYFLEWFGTDFAIEPGRAYEFIAATDTTWNPTEYSNEAFDEMLARRRVQNDDIEVHSGKSVIASRQPDWIIDGKGYKPKERAANEEYFRYRSSVSHVIHGHFSMHDCDGVVFAAYPVDRPDDVLTQDMIGCGVACKDDHVSVWFDAGNFRSPWKNGEELLLIIEALHQGRAYCAVERLTINAGCDIQFCDDIVFMEIPWPHVRHGEAQWQELVHDEIIGYSIYQGDERVNNRLVETNSYRATEDISIKPVFTGGFETVYSSRGGPFDPVPRAYSFTISPNPFVRAMHIQYALPEQTTVNVKVYDVTGAKVTTLVNDVQEPGYYTIRWQGEDDRGRTLSAGVYFVTVEARGYSSKHKVVFVR